MYNYSVYVIGETWWPNKFACQLHSKQIPFCTLLFTYKKKRFGPELYLIQSQIFQPSYKGTIGKLLEQTEQIWLGFYSGVSFSPQYFGHYFL